MLRTHTSRALPVLAIVVVLLATGCSQSTKPFEPVVAAPPQSANVGWTESFPEVGPALIFRVGTVRVLSDGWEADISIENQTGQRYEIPPATSAKRRFGIMIFSSDSLDDLKRRSENGELPTIRSAQAVTPSLPPVLAPGERWPGTISAAGALPAGQWLRIVFGPLTVKGTAPKGVEPEITWITDHAYRLSAAPSGVAASIATLVP